MKCPDCAEEIPGGSKICPICKSNLAGGGGGGRGIVDPQKAQEIKAKISRLNTLSFVVFIPGLLLQFGTPAVITVTTPEQLQMVLALRGLGAIMLIVGFGLYAAMKGRSGAWGLMGLLSCLGLLFLALMSKCCHNCRQIGGRNETECTNCAAPM